MAVPDEAARAAESARRARYAALLAEDANREIDDDDGSVRVPFEELPLHFPRAARGRELCEEWDFRPLEPPPPPPAEILRRSLASGEKKAAGKANANAKATDAPRPAPGPGVETARAETTRAETRASSLSDASAALVSSLDGLLADLKAREEEAERRSRARTEAEARELRVATQRVAQLAARAPTLEAEAEAAERLASGEANGVLRRPRGRGAFVFDAAVAKAASDAMAAMREELRWWYASRVGDAARRIQKHFRGFVGRRRATKRRATLAAGLAYMRHASLKLRFEAWRQNASDQRRHAKLTKALDRKLAWARRRSTFNAWRTRAGKAKAFAASALRLARALGFKNHAAPAFAAWAEATRARRRTRRAARRSSRRRGARSATRYGNGRRSPRLGAWRVLNTAGDAMAAHEAAEAARAADAKANDAWAAAPGRTSPPTAPSPRRRNDARGGHRRRGGRGAPRGGTEVRGAEERGHDPRDQGGVGDARDCARGEGARVRRGGGGGEGGGFRKRRQGVLRAHRRPARDEGVGGVRRVDRAAAAQGGEGHRDALRGGGEARVLRVEGPREGPQGREGGGGGAGLHRRAPKGHQKTRQEGERRVRKAFGGIRKPKREYHETHENIHRRRRRGRRAPERGGGGGEEKSIGRAFERRAARRGEAGRGGGDGRRGRDGDCFSRGFPPREAATRRSTAEARRARGASRLGRSWVDAGGVDAWVASAAAANVVERTRLRRAEEAYALGRRAGGGGDETRAEGERVTESVYW